MLPMRDELICRTCEVGCLQLVTRRRHGWLAGMFGSVLVVVSIASLTVWLCGLFAAFGKSWPVLSEILPFLGAWLVTSLLLGIVGAIAIHKESVLACSSCHAITRVLSADEIEETPAIEPGAAPRARPST
jgi:hypothetical protein